MLKVEFFPHSDGGYEESHLPKCTTALLLVNESSCRIRLDATRLFKVHLDKTQQTNIEHKTDTFASVYKKLTGKEVNFEFPESML